MSEEIKSSNTNLIIIGIISLIIGGLIVYYLLKPKITVASLQQQSQQPFNSLNIENRLDTIEQRLQQLTSITSSTPTSPIHNTQ